MSREAEILKRAYRANLSLFIQRSFADVGNGDYHHNWHIDAIAEYLTACKDREIKRLIINMPPRSLKSIAVTVAFPAWLLGNNPKLEIMAASYSQDLSEDHSVFCRKIIQSEWYKSTFPDLELAESKMAKFTTTAGGARRATSVTGTSTGKGANFLILDDPLNPGQAASDADRKTALNFIQHTWPSRLNDKKNDVSIVVMQRLHQEDPAGFLLAQGGWEHLCLPAINDIKKTISIGTFHKVWEQGEYLDPIRMDKEVLDREKLNMGSFAFAGQYLQLPVPEGGGIIKEQWWQKWEGIEPPSTYDIIQVYDTAFTEKTQNDYSARTTWGLFKDNNNEDNIILLERMNERLEYPELLDTAKKAYRKFTKSKTNEPPLVLIEEKAAGLPLVQDMRKAKLRVKGIKRNANSGDKVSRAYNVTHLFESGKVWIPCNIVMVDGKKHFNPKPYAQEVIDQCALFPNGTHDDLVDTVIDAVAHMRNRGVKSNYDEEDEPVNRDTGKKKRYY